MLREELVEQGVAGAAVACAAACAALALSWWLGQDPAGGLALRVPVTPPELAALSSPDPRQTIAVDLRGSYLASGVVPAAASGSWPRFRGADFDNVGREPVPLAERWPEGGPPVLWAADLGEGHAGAAVHGGRVYILDYDEARESDLLRCLALADGREIWRRWYRTGAKRNHGISRTVPAVTERWVVTIGPRCHVLCVGAERGDFLWGIDLAREYGTAEPLWFTAQNPLIDGGVAVIAPGGRALMIGVDCATGRVLWETPNPKGWKMSHASVVPMTIRGRRTYVYPALGALVGVAADGEDAGALLWATEEWSHSVVAPSPVALDGDRILVTAGYGVGSAVFRVGRAGGGWRAELERRFDRTEFAAEQQTPLVHAGHLFTVMPKDGGALREQFVCLTPAGTVRWSSGKEARFGLGPFLEADGKFFILAEDGMLTMARASTEEFVPLARARVLDGKDAWAPLAIAGGRLLARDAKRMVCLDLRKKEAPPPAAAFYREGPPVPLGTHDLDGVAVDEDGTIAVLAGKELLRLDAAGGIAGRAPLPGPAFGLAFGGGRGYLALRDRIAVLDRGGRVLATWESLGEQAWLTSIAVRGRTVFAADAGSRLVWRFDTEGRLLGFFGRRDRETGEEGFVVPSPYFDLALGPEGDLWVVNPGMHRVQRRSPEGRLLEEWGTTAPGPEGFTGCCNPSHLAVLPDGSFVTSEKGTPRVKHYDRAGRLIELVAGAEAFAPHAIDLDLAVAPGGRILVLDPSRSALRVFVRPVADEGGGSHGG